MAAHLHHLSFPRIIKQWWESEIFWSRQWINITFYFLDLNGIWKLLIFLCKPKTWKIKPKTIFQLIKIHAQSYKNEKINYYFFFILYIHNLDLFSCFHMKKTKNVRSSHDKPNFIFCIINIIQIRLIYIHNKCYKNK